MVERGKEKSDPGLVNTIGHLLRSTSDRDPKIFEYISGACFGSNRFIPMLQYHHARRCEHEYTGGRNIDQFKSIATRPNYVYRRLVSQPKSRTDRQLEKGASEIPEFFARFSLVLQSQEKAALIELGNRRVSQLSGRFARLIHPEINPVP